MIVDIGRSSSTKVYLAWSNQRILYFIFSYYYSEYKDIGNISHFLKVEHQSMFLTGTFIWLQAGTLSTPCWRQWRQDAGAAGGDLPAPAAPRSPGLLLLHFK